VVIERWGTNVSRKKEDREAKEERKKRAADSLPF
jgi:hypothetical protein